MIKLLDHETGRLIGSITEAQLQYLVDQLEEEWDEDQEYYLSTDSLDMLAEGGMDTGLVEMLREAMGDRGEIEIRWARM
jgi:hypothetical protein